MAEENGLEFDSERSLTLSREALASNTSIAEIDKNSEQAEDQEDSNKKRKDEESKKRSVAFYKLFCFADSKDVVLMIVGTVAAVGNGVSTPIVTLFFGQLIYSFGDIANANEVVHEVSKVCLRFVYLALGAGFAAFFQVSCWTITGERQAARIRSSYLKTILRQDITFFDTETNTGEVVARMSGDTVLIQDAMGEKVGKFTQLMAAFVGGFVIAFVKGWFLALVLLSCIPLLVISGAVMSMIISKMSAQGQATHSEIGIMVEQTISSIRTVVSFTGEKRAIQRYNESLNTSYSSSIQEGLTAGLGLGSVSFIIFSTYALALWFGSKMILNKDYNGGVVINVVFALLIGGMSLGQASPCISAFAAGQVAAYKMFKTIDRKPEIDVYDSSGQKLDDIRGDIELRDVCFCYPARPYESIFTRFSLFIPSGTTTALVGESGSGKSTVINLIERFYDPQSGEVLIDGINLKEFQLRWIREKIGLVSQEPVLFASSIRDNIAYGKGGATPEEIEAAAELANAAKFIDKMPQGLDTILGEHGTQLSVGQKQRIAIARAILKDPRILLLDEATSALDAESEWVVQEALDKVMVNRTTIVVAHRLSTVRNAAMIVVIHRGSIVEKGSHSKLLEDPNGAYCKLIQLQEVNQTEELQPATSDPNKPQITSDSFRQSSQSFSILQPISRGSSLGVGSSSGRSSIVLPTVISLSPESDARPPSRRESGVMLFRLAYLNKSELPMLLVGSVAAVIDGCVLPVFGILFSSIIWTFYEPPHNLRKDTRFWCLMFVMLGLVSLVASTAQMYFFSVAGSRLIRRICSLCFERVVHMEIGWFDEGEHSCGAIGVRLSADAATVRSLVGDTLALLVQNSATAVAGLVIAFEANWQLALIFLAMIPLIGVNGWTQMKFMKGFGADAKAMYEEASQVANDAVGSIRTVASFCAEEKVMELYSKKCEGPVKTGVQQGLISGIGFGMSVFLVFSVYASCFYAGAWLVEDGKTTAGEVFRVFFTLNMTAIGISQSSSLAPDATKANASAASIFAILDRKSKIDSSDDSGTTLADVKGDIEFQHVSFRYPLRPDIQIFRDLCLLVQSGKTVALVGESGGGKSTAIALLQRFYDPESGRILLDGVEIKKLQLRWLRQQMGLVSQEPVLFNDTIRANIAYGKEEETTEAEIIAAAESANAHQFISGLQQGYHTLVGERGVQLSGGQKQRVAIARAILKSPKILLLDEATSALDAESERAVQEALDRVSGNRTSMVVAHQLSTIKGADLIAVVKNGEIIEKGRHDDLINIKDGVYASLVALHMNTSS